MPRIFINKDNWRSRVTGKPRRNKDKHLHRCLVILNLMQAGKVNINDLANQFGVNSRSILRDLHSLDKAGFAMRITDRGVWGLMKNL